MVHSNTDRWTEVSLCIIKQFAALNIATCVTRLAILELLVPLLLLGVTMSELCIQLSSPLNTKMFSGEQDKVIFGNSFHRVLWF